MQGQGLELPEVFRVFFSIHFEFSDPPQCQHDAWMIALSLKRIVKSFQFFIADPNDFSSLGAGETLITCLNAHRRKCRYSLGLSRSMPVGQHSRWSQA